MVKCVHYPWSPPKDGSKTWFIAFYEQNTIGWCVAQFFWTELLAMIILRHLWIRDYGYIGPQPYCLSVTANSDRQTVRQTGRGLCTILNILLRSWFNWTFDNAQCGQFCNNHAVSAFEHADGAASKTKICKLEPHSKLLNFFDRLCIATCTQLHHLYLWTSCADYCSACWCASQIWSAPAGRAMAVQLRGLVLIFINCVCLC